jgi:hypothetical protein
MDFLKEILGEELFNQIAERINAHNGNEANKENQIKIGNLASGDYVGKGKHGDLQARFDSQGEELRQAKSLIAELQKATKGDEALQNKVTEFQNQAVQLQKKLNETLIESGLRIAFMEAGGVDIDYLIWKAKTDNGGKALELGEDQKVKGIDDIVSGLKTSSPTHFKKGGNGVKVEENPLPKSEPGGMTRAEFMRKPYAERAAFASENPEAYKNLMNN